MADFARVSLEDCKDALSKLTKPDEYSRSRDHEGRRVEEVDGGWKILNHAKYRAKLNNDDRREYLRIKQQEHRLRSKLPNGGEGTPIERTKGFVYYAVDGQKVKIGFSTNPWARVWEFRTILPSIELAAIERGTMATEKARHNQFEPFRVDREWFSRSPEIDSTIKLLASNVSTMSTGCAGRSTPSTHAEAAPEAAPEAKATPVNTLSGKPDDREASKEREPVGGYHKDARSVLHILNEACGRGFREVDANLSVISARLREPGVDLAGVRKMIARQCLRWKNTQFSEYLTPITLFSKTKFDSYYAARDLPIASDAKHNPRNDGIAEGGTDYGEAAKRKLERQALEDQKRYGQPNLGEA